MKQGDLDADLVFVSKYFHVDYAEVEKNLRRVLEITQKRFKGNIVLVYGDLCLGQNGEMKKFAEEHGVVKVDAVNCIDCILGGKEKFLKSTPTTTSCSLDLEWQNSSFISRRKCGSKKISAKTT